MSAGRGAHAAGPAGAVREAAVRMARGLLRFVPPGGAASPRGVTILAYHLVGARTGMVVDIPAHRFRSHLRLLRERCEIVPLEAAVELLASGDLSFGRRTVVLTFDDAYENFRSDVFPMLAELRVPATLYVPVGFIEGVSGHPFDPPAATSLLPMSWAQLGEVAGSGLVSIGSHTLTHPDLCRLDPAALDWEMAEPRRVLEARLGVPVTSLCYPMGLVSPLVVDTAAAHYASAVRGGGTVVRPGMYDPYQLPRISVLRDMTTEHLARVVGGDVWWEERVADVLRQGRARLARR